MPCLKNGTIQKLEGIMLTRDSSLHVWEPHLLAACRYFNSRSLFHILYHIQLFMKVCACVCTNLSSTVSPVCLCQVSLYTCSIKHCHISLSYTHMYLRTYTHMHTNMRARANIHHTHTHARPQTQTHTHTHTQDYIRAAQTCIKFYTGQDGRKTKVIDLVLRKEYLNCAIKHLETALQPKQASREVSGVGV